MIWFLLENKKAFISLQHFWEECARHLWDKVVWIHSKVSSTFQAGPIKVDRGAVLLNYLRWISSCWPEEMGRLIGTINSATAVLDPCPSWLAKASKKEMCDYVQVFVNSSLREGMVSLLWKEAVLCPSSRNYHWTQPFWTFVLPNFLFQSNFILKYGARKTLITLLAGSGWGLHPSLLFFISCWHSKPVVIIPFSFTSGGWEFRNNMMVFLLPGSVLLAVCLFIN